MRSSSGKSDRCAWADVEIETESGKTGFVDEGAQISRIAHFAGGVLDADSDARMMRVQN